jgi:hypothetical protein
MLDLGNQNNLDMQPPRRSARLKEQTSHKKKQDQRKSDAQSDDEGYESPAVAKSKENLPKKRTRKQTAPLKARHNTNKRRRVGKLRNLPGMPIDILFEVGHEFSDAVRCELFNHG